jgi:hypothetical protein
MHVCLTDLIPDERAVESFRPMSPILSRRALRQTPKFGGSGAVASPDSLRSTLGAYKVVPAKVPDTPTPPLPDLEEILYFYSFPTPKVFLTVEQGCSVQD